MTAIDRRTLLIGAGLLFASCGSVPKKKAGGLFAGTALQDNPLARDFQRADLPLPPVTVLDGQREIPLSSLTGRTRIVALWAEWCAPCLIEARDLAALRRRYAAPGFDIVSVLTASMKKLDPAGARARLHEAGADGLTLLVEPNGGSKVVQSMSPGSAKGWSLPCTLLVDRHGRVRGISRGATLAPASIPAPTGGAETTTTHTLTEAEKQALLANGRTLWATSDGDAFARGLRDGVLDRV